MDTGKASPTDNGVGATSAIEEASTPMSKAAKLDEGKDELLRRAAEICQQTPGTRSADPGDVLDFLRQYYRHVAVEDLLGRDPVDIYGAAEAHRHLAHERTPGRAAVRAYTPTIDEHGWEPGHTVVEVVTDDMPFLVDSVTMELTRHDVGIHLVVHPQLQVRRNVTGTLEGLGEATAEPAGLIAESWIHVEINRQPGQEKLHELEADLGRVLEDVRCAVEDWPKMRTTALDIADELACHPPQLPEAEVDDTVELLQWLANNHFTFLGYREYELVDADGADQLHAVSGTGLGILRADKPGSDSFAALSPKLRAKAREKRLLIVTKANSRATVHRSAYLDYVGIKRFDDAGNVVGEQRFLGLFTHGAYNESITRIPLLRGKLDEVLQQARLTSDSHDGKDLIEMLESYPRDELFQTSTEDLLRISLGVLRLRERKQLKLFLRADDYGRFMSCLVYLPRDRYTTQVRLRLQDILLAAFGGTTIDYTAMVSESVLARLHVVVRGERGQELSEVDPDELEARLAAATRSWADDLADAVVEQCGEERAAELLRRYGEAFPEAYKEDFPARTAVADLKRLEEQHAPDEIGMNLYEPYGAVHGERRLKIYKVGEPILLSGVLPLLQRMGVQVIDERPYEIDRHGDGRAWIYDFGLRYEPSPEVDHDAVKRLYQEAFAALWRGEIENDGFNALVLRAGLSWRQVMVLRAYCRYVRQAATAFSQDYIQQTVLDNTHIAKLLVRLFESRFNPRYAETTAERSDAIVEEIRSALDEVASLDEDRILRSYLTMILATLRTNYFQTTSEGTPKPYLSLKFDSRAIPELPRPRPRFGIFVYSPRMEAIHLRFGPVSRGGIRWSDRREDFRTEILGLAKAQMVKNSIIVPVGSKGGFVLKQAPADREALREEGIACYRQFMSGMLDLTDNLRSGEVVPPPDVVRHDGDDTYLVVAADKGTATFSDIANAVAEDYDYWLGDAFASGGSTGYDHKAMGITARGAWESVKRHFRELGVDTQSQDFTAAGVGDMSGDVFGNGMLLSRHIRLVAAFDHRHIFLDPAPDADAGFRERERMFNLGRSTWDDYDRATISEGGGIYSRNVKSVPVTPQVRSALGLAGGVGAMAPHELIQAILAAPVDLLWNGGIGTYVKASTETDADVGDKANDPVRADADQLRCRVVGEGGNLGFTQAGRIEYALGGGRINTDFIDNSAGVDSSDQEVNIKIMLEGVVRDGDMTRKQRNAFLGRMTDEVAELVLRDNYEQNLALANARAQAPAMLHVHARHIARRESHGTLDRQLESLPSEKTISERRQAGLGLTSPELSMLLAHTKINLEEEILDSTLPDDPALTPVLHGYFPTPLREEFGDRLSGHPLSRQIITTCVVNDMVNRSGTTFAFRIHEESGASASDIARAYLAARSTFDMPRLWKQIEALGSQIDTDTQTKMFLEARKLTERAARWLLHNRRSPLDIRATIDFFSPDASTISPELAKLLAGRDLVAYEERRDDFVSRGVPEELAEWVSAMVPMYSVLDLVEIAHSTDRPVREVAEVYFDLADRLGITRLRERIIALPRDDRWKTMARSGLRDDLYAAHASLTRNVLVSTEPGASPEQRLIEWEERNSEAVARAGQTLSEVWEAETFDLAILQVALRVVRTLVASSTLPG